MTWRNPQLSQAADQWRAAQGAVLQAQRRIRVRDEESSSPAPGRARPADVNLLAEQAHRALAECLRLARQADPTSRR